MELVAVVLTVAALVAVAELGVEPVAAVRVVVAVAVVVVAAAVAAAAVAVLVLAEVAKVAMQQSARRYCSARSQSVALGR